MAIFRVTNTNDSGAGSLRQAVRDANALAGADQIVFDPIVFSSENTTISIGAFNSWIDIADSLTINGDVDGDGDADITLDGGGNTQILRARYSEDQLVGSARDVLLDSLNFTNGVTNVGGAIGSIGSNLTIRNASFSDNSASFAGGAIFVLGGSVFVENSTFTGNTAPTEASIRLSNADSVLTLANTTFNGSSTPAPGDIGGNGIVIQAPYITSNGGGATAAISVVENTTAVTDVQVIDAVNSEGNGITYSLLPDPSTPRDNALFTIDPVSGLLSFIAAPYFELPRDTDGDNVYNIQVVATNAAGVTDVQGIAVTVTDAPVDDLAPGAVPAPGELFLISGNFVRFSVAENTSTVIDFFGIDDVSSEGDGITYSLSGEVGVGTLQSDISLLSIDPSTGVLSFLSPPDFENPSDANGDNSYIFRLVVTDAAGNVNSDLLGAIEVTDEDESNPVFGFNSGSATILTPENRAFVTDITATDDVSTEGDGLTYQLSGADAALFTLDATTGVLAFRSTPDFETPGSAAGSNSYSLTVDVRDAAGRGATQLLDVSVTNQEDLAPVFTSNGGGTTAAVSVAENTTAVTDVQATDDVSAEGNGLTYLLSSEIPFNTIVDNGLFTIDPVSGLLSFITAPDFETPGDADGDNVYNVLVAAI
ncbi:MAG: cadherin repeat domain-containing protein, partial [Pseudomonadota bacterium]